METFVSLGRDVRLMRLTNAECSLYLIGRLIDRHHERQYNLSVVDTKQIRQDSDIMLGM